MIKTTHPYEDLANAIILQALKDHSNERYREETERFFKSEWYETLTDLPSSAILKIAHAGIKPTTIMSAGMSLDISEKRDRL